MTFRYLTAVREVIDRLESTQAEAVESAAELVIRSITAGGVVFCAEIGHGTQGDFLNRAGGLAAVQPFAASLSVTDPVPDCLRNRPRANDADREIEAVRAAVATSNVRPGDVIMVGSVSGRNIRPIEQALAFRAQGGHAIGLTAFSYSADVESLHPSGRRLRDAVDVAIDIGTPYGDAAVQVPGIEPKVMPVSGVAFDVAGWMIWERVMTRMASAGDPPTVYMSVNGAGGQAYYEAARARYNERGY